MTETFTITRLFNAPRALVWKAWTEPKLFAQWFGPKGTQGQHVNIMDVREGGMLHSSLKAPDGTEIWAKFVYREVIKPERLVWEHSISDKDGGIKRHPFQKDWPLKLLTTVMFEELGNKTKLTLSWEPLEATDAELKAFSEAMPSMNQGWGGSFDVLEECLKETKAA